jgi:hypothetical protein
VGRRVGRGTAGDDLGPPSRSPPPSPLRTDDDPSTKPTRVGMGDSGWEERYGARLLLEVVFSSCHPCHLLPPEEVFDVFSRLPCRLH